MLVKAEEDGDLHIQLGVATWPFAFPRGDIRRPLERCRMFLVLVLRMLHLKSVANGDDRSTAPNGSQAGPVNRQNGALP
jgi:hypothetical protein